jgi:hypothetical protein
MLLAQADRRLGVVERLAQAIPDARDPPRLGNSGHRARECTRQASTAIHPALLSASGRACLIGA